VHIQNISGLKDKVFWYFVIFVIFHKLLLRRSYAGKTPFLNNTILEKRKKIGFIFATIYKRKKKFNFGGNK